MFATSNYRYKVQLEHFLTALEENSESTFPENVDAYAWIYLFFSKRQK